MTRAQLCELMNARRALGDVDAHCMLTRESYEELEREMPLDARGQLIIITCNGPVTVERAFD